MLVSAHLDGILCVLRNRVTEPSARAAVVHAGSPWRQRSCGSLFTALKSLPQSIPKRVAVKYCGGCDPDFDRVAYFRQVRQAAAGAVEWVSLEDHGYRAVLLICGCATACPEREMEGKLQFMVCVRSENVDPDAIVQSLLAEGGNYEDQNQARLHRQSAG